MVIPKINSAHGSDTRNIINAAIDLINMQGKSIQDLVAKGQLTPTQYAQLISIVNGNIKSGEITNQDIDKNNFKIDQTMISDSLRQMIAGDAPINAVPADGSITREKLAKNSVGENQVDFVSANNLWDGIHHRYFHLQGSADVVRHIEALDTYHYSVIAKVTPGKEFTVLKKLGGDRFNVAVVNKIPAFNETEDALFVHRGDNSPSEQQTTFTIPSNGNYVIVHVNSFASSLPEVVISEGAEALGDETLKFNKDIDGYAKLIKSKKNLFNGMYEHFRLSYVFGNDYVGVAENTDDFEGRVVVKEVNPSSKYSITFPNKDHDMFRIGGFSSRPTIGERSVEIIKLGLTDDIDPEENIYTFTTGANTKYIAIYVSTVGAEPILQIEVGEPTEYEPYAYIPEKYIKRNPKVKEESGIFAKKDARFNFYENLNVLYTHNGIDDYFSSSNSLTASQFNQLYKDLSVEHSDKLNLEIAGIDEWGNEILKIETKVLNYNEVETGSGNDGTTGDSINQPKLVITTGMHGHEKSAMYATYYFLKELLESESDLMNFILDNIKLVIMPLCNPSGFNKTQRHNDNNVDINRNFWSTSNVQAETEIIKQVLNAHSDMDFYIDYHTLIPRSTIIGYTFTNNQALAYTANNMYRNVGRHWQKTNSSMPQGRDVVFSFTTPALSGMAVEYVEKELSVDSVLLELTNAYSYLASGNYTEPVVRMGVEFLTNMITGALRLRQ